MEKINHPKHYDKHPARIECIDVIEPFCFNLGSVIKYVWRAELKPGEDDLDDLRKAEWYIKREIQRREYERLVSPKPKPPQFDAEKVRGLIDNLGMAAIAFGSGKGKWLYKDNAENALLTALHINY